MKIDKAIRQVFVIFYIIHLVKRKNCVEIAREYALRLDALDFRILGIIQGDSNRSTTRLARELQVPVTTVYSKIRRLGKAGIVRGYRASIDPKTLGIGTIAFILASVSYGAQRYHLDRHVAKQVARFPEVQEVHLISGEWDFLIKIRARDVAGVGNFLAEKLRTVKGIDKTITCMVFETAKETTEIDLSSSAVK